MRTIELTIQDVAFGGKGVGRYEGKAVFVPLTIEGETVLADIVRQRKQLAEGELVEVREASPERVRPPCPYFGRCGGCAYQHIDYPHQLQIKWRQVRDLLQRIGKITDPPMRPIVPSPDVYSYRNRITVHALDGIVGFFRRESNRLIDVEQCPISDEVVNEQLGRLRATKPADGHYTVRADFGPRIFSQTNDEVAEALRKLVVEMTPADQDLLIDAYCGAGFFAKALVEKFQRIVGIDWDRFAIEEAQKTATAREIYMAADVAEALEQTRSGGFLTADLDKRRLENRRSLTIIVDPPATGLTHAVKTAIVNLAPRLLLYVSCNPPTLARDLKDLASHFTLQTVTPLDMFPQTAEIEVLAQLSHRAGSS